MGDPACWLHVVCTSCGVVSEDLDLDNECPSCRRALSAAQPSVDAATDSPNAATPANAAPPATA